MTRFRMRRSTTPWPAAPLRWAWNAHGLKYGIPRSIDADIRQDRIVVCNVSRTVVADCARPLRACDGGADHGAARAFWRRGSNSAPGRATARSSSASAAKSMMRLFRMSSSTPSGRSRPMRGACSTWCSGTSWSVSERCAAARVDTDRRWSAAAPATRFDLETRYVDGANPGFRQNEANLVRSLGIAREAKRRPSGPARSRCAIRNVGARP